MMAKFIDRILMAALPALVLIWYWEKIPRWLGATVLSIYFSVAFLIINDWLRKPQREFFSRLNRVFEGSSDEAKRDFFRKEAVAALDDIARAANTVKFILWIIVILLLAMLLEQVAK